MIYGYESLISTQTIIGAFIIGLFSIICYWAIFEKAKKPGWAAIVPFYNSYILFEITFGQGLLFLLLAIPVVNVIVSIILCFKLASVFGKSTAYGFGIWLLPIIFIPMLAFGKSKYCGIK